MGESKEGVVDDLLLGDGFSIVDSSEKKTPSPEKKTEESPPAEAVEASLEDSAAAADPDEVIVISPKKEPEEPKTNGHDATLLITTEEDLDLEKADKKKDAPEDSAAPDKDGKKKQGDLWVSNITRHIKAADLKKHFSKHGKVLTAKIVTNGKSFFGYLLMEHSLIASKCVRALHGSTLDGRKLAVSRQRPDQKKTARDRRATTVKPRAVKKDDPAPAKAAADKKSEDREKERSKKRDEDLENARRLQEKLRRDIDYQRRENLRLKRYLTEEQRRSRAEATKSRTLSRDLQEVEAKLREERRKFDRERDVLEKNARMDRAKLEADRTLIKKDLDEVKKLREYLKRKIEEEAARPVERRAPRAASPYAYSSKRFREAEPKPKYVEPPSPPKLTSSRRRSPGGEKERRPGGYGHASSMVVAAKVTAPAPPRNIWTPGAFHQDVWRVNPGGAPAPPFASSSGGPYRQEYSSSASKGGYSSSSQRDFSKRDHYSSSSLRKY